MLKNSYLIKIKLESLEIRFQIWWLWWWRIVVCVSLYIRSFHILILKTIHIWFEIVTVCISTYSDQYIQHDHLLKVLYILIVCLKDIAASATHTSERTTTTTYVEEIKTHMYARVWCVCVCVYLIFYIVAFAPNLFCLLNWLTDWWLHKRTARCSSCSSVDKHCYRRTDA